MYEKASYDLIRHEHVCHENAWEWLRMHENDSYSWWGVCLIYGWVALYDMHDKEWECMRMAGDDWESLIFKEGMVMVVVILAWSTLYDMHTNVWESIIRSHKAWACMSWECMRMTENDWQSLISMDGGNGILGWLTWYGMHANVWESIIRSHKAWSCMWWECMRMTETAWEWLTLNDEWCVSLGWHTLYGMHDNEWGCVRMIEDAWEWIIFREDVCHSTLTYIIRHAWYCMTMHENEW